MRNSNFHHLPITLQYILLVFKYLNDIGQDFQFNHCCFLVAILHTFLLGFKFFRQSMLCGNLISSAAIKDRPLKS